MKKRIIVSLVYVFLSTGWAADGNAKSLSADYQTFKLLLGAQRAKDVCSCHFTAQMPTDYCVSITREGIPSVDWGDTIVSVNVDDENKEVRSNGQVAHFINSEEGCQLQ